MSGSARSGWNHRVSVHCSSGSIGVPHSRRHPRRPAGAGGVDEVEAGDLLGRDHVGVADDPLDVEQPGPGRDAVEAAQDEEYVVVVAGVALARVAPVDRDVLAAALERVGERPREVGVAPPVAARGGGRGDVDGPPQPGRRLVDALHRPHDELGDERRRAAAVLGVGRDPAVALVGHLEAGPAQQVGCPVGRRGRRACERSDDIAPISSSATA